MKDLQKMYNELMTVNSKLKKLEIIKKYPENKEILFYIYHPQYIFGVTSANLKKNKDLPNPFPVTYKSIIYLLDSLRLRKITGHAAINAVNDFIKANPKHEDLIYKIIDRNLKASIGITEINKVWPGLIPEFKVQLADLYINAKVAENSKKLKKVLKASKIDYSERWYASRKLDGLRCVTIFDEEGVPVCWSRQGKEFFTLDVLKKSFEDIPVNLRKNMVFDGELCILKENGDEDFKAIGKLYGKTDKIDGVKVYRQIANPHYKIFDCLSIESFNERKGTELFRFRYEALMILEASYFNKEFLTVPEQVILRGQPHLDSLAAAAVKAGWEGLIIRKDVPYVAKRSKNMLKVKPFFDEEFVVVSIEMTEKNMLNDEGLMVPVKCMGSAFIKFKGNLVGVGSGWSDEERIKFGTNPESLIGKEITVRYTEESEDEEGNPSLRFPRVKIVHDGKRNI